MTVGRTHDSTFLLAKTAVCEVIAPWVGLSWPGTVTVTTEAFVGKTLKAASVHQRGSSISFSQVFSTTGFEGNIDNLIGAADYASDESDDVWAALICDEPDSWQIMPVDFGRPGLNAPTTGSIVRPFSLTQAGRGAYGTVLADFDRDSAGTTNLSINSLDGTTLADAVLVVVITETQAGLSDIRLSDGSADHDIPHAAPGLHVVDDDTATGSLSIQTTGGGAAGFVLAGVREAIPSG